MLIEHPSLLESFERKGSWWLPEEPDHCCNGVLRYEGQQLSLECFGELRVVNQNNTASYQLPVVFGITGDGQRYTLCEAFQIHSSGRIDGIRITRYHVTCLFVGCHVLSPHMARFPSGSFSYSHLEEWIGHQPFITKFATDTSDPLVTAEYLHRHCDPMDISIPAIDATLHFTSRATTRGPGFRSLRVDHSAAIEIIPDAPQPLLWFENQSLQFQRLLTFFVDSPVQLTRVAFRPPQNATFGDVSVVGLPKDFSKTPAAEEHYMHDVHFYRHDQRRRLVTTGERLPAFMLVTLSDISDRLANILQSWFNNAERLKHVYNLFFASIHTETFYLESQFLQLAQALECYSRTRSDSEYMSEEDYKSVYDKLVAAIPKDLGDSHKQALKGRIKYGYTHSFRKRVDGLLKSLEADTIALFCKDRNTFAGKVKATRNYYVHLDDSTDDRPYPVDKLFPASQSIRIMISALLLKELGFGESKIRSLIMNSELADMLTLASEDNL